MYSSTNGSLVVDPSEEITYDGNPYGDRYYFDAEHVVIITHGNVGQILLSSESEYEQLVSSNISNPNYNLLYINELQNKRIGSLNLYICLCGRTTESGYSIPNEFLQYHSNIQQVVAPDAELYANISNGEMKPYFFVSWLGSFQYHEMSSINEFITLYTYYTTFEKEYWVTNLHAPFQDCTGFRCFYRGGVSYDVFEDDVVYGELYIINPGTSSQGAFVVADVSLRDGFSSNHDYILNG